MSNESPREEILRTKELIRMLGLSRTSLWRFERDEDFPKRVQLGVRSIGWKLSEINAWIKGRQLKS